MFDSKPIDSFIKSIMEYNDYQIFDDKTYEILNSNFKISSTTDRKTITQQLCIELQSCKNYCSTFAKDYNKQISSEITLCKNSIDQLLNNITSTLNTNTPTSKIYKEFNLFDLLQKLLHCVDLLFKWNTIEEKEYYKILIRNSSETILNSSFRIIKACKSSTVKFFKYM